MEQATRIKATKVFRKNRLAYESGQYRLIANEGSTRSTKTYSICQLLALYIPEIEPVSISIVSPSLPHLKRGARRDFLEILEGAGKYSDDAFNKTDNIYNFANGSFVEFFGAEDVGRVRGPGRDILYVNEANLMQYQIYKQLALRTKKTVFIDYNPADEQSWVYTEADKKGNILIHSTYNWQMRTFGKYLDWD
jgi:phage terminase large subunit